MRTVPYSGLTVEPSSSVSQPDSGLSGAGSRPTDFLGFSCSLGHGGAKPCHGGARNSPVGGEGLVRLQ